MIQTLNNLPLELVLKFPFLGVTGKIPFLELEIKFP